MLNLFRWLGRFRSQVSRPPIRKAAVTRLSLEQLEDRITPAVRIWDGGGADALWGTAANWDAPVVAGDTLVFGTAGLGKLASVNNFAANTQFTAIRFEGNMGAGYSLTGNAIRLSAGISQINNLTGDLTVNLNIALTASQTFNVTSSDVNLRLQGAISGVAFGITKTGDGTLLYEGATANSYSGGTAVNGGSLLLNKQTAGVTAIPGNLVINTGANVELLTSTEQIANSAIVTVGAFGTFSLNGHSETIAGLTLTGGAVDSGASTLIVNGNINATLSATPASISGTLNFNGLVRTVTVANGAGTDDLTIFANITNGGLIKAGAGKLVLAGIGSNYALATTVSAGTLEVQTSNALGTAAGGTTVANGATLQINDVPDVGVTLADALTLNGDGVGGNGALRDVTPNSYYGNGYWGTIFLATTSRVGVEDGTAFSLTGIISGPGGLTKVGTGWLDLSGGGANSFTGTTTVNAGHLFLIKDSGAKAIGGALVIGDGIGGANADVLIVDSVNQLAGTTAVTVNSSGTFNLDDASATIGALTLTGGANVITGAGTLTLGGNIVSNAASQSATISGNLNLGAVTRTVTVADGAAPEDLVISAVISGAGGLTKAGPGKLVLDANNGYTGATTVNAGTLAIRNNTALGASGSDANNTTVAAGASLVIDNAAVTSVAERLVLNGTGVAAGGALQLQGTGINSTWAGNVKLNTAASIAVADAASTLTMNSGVISGAATSSATVNGVVVTTPITLTKVGTGTLALGGVNTYLGATIVSVGILDVQNNNALGGNPFTSPVGAGTTVAAGATVLLEGSGLDVGETLTLNGNGIGGLGALRLTGVSADSAWSGNIVLATNSRIGVDDSNSFLSLGFTGGTPIINISGAGGLIKVGAGELDMNGVYNNTYTGTTFVNEGTLGLNIDPATIAVGNLVIGDGVGTDTVVLFYGKNIADTANVTINSSGILDVNGFNETIGSLTLNGGNVIDGAGVGALTLNGNITSNAAATSATIEANLNLGAVARTLTVADGAAVDDLVISGVLSGSGVLTKAGPGKLVLAADNDPTFTGAVTVSAGTLAIRHNSALGTVAAGTSVTAGASLVIDVNSLVVTENVTLNGTGVLTQGALQFQGGAMQQAIWTGNVTLGSAVSIGVSGSMESYLVLNGVITDGASSFALSKVGGDGVLVLSAANTYDGGTNINIGVLFAANDVNNPGSATGTGTVTVNNEGILAGNGRVGNVVVKSGGVLAPAVDDVTAGTLNTGSVYFSTGGIFNVTFDSSGAASQLNVTGTVSLSGAILSIYNVGANAATAYTIINKQGGGSVLGTFSAFVDPIPTIDTIVYNGGTGNDVVLTTL